MPYFFLFAWDFAFVAHRLCFCRAVCVADGIWQNVPRGHYLLSLETFCVQEHVHMWLWKSCMIICLRRKVTWGQKKETGSFRIKHGHLGSLSQWQFWSCTPSKDKKIIWGMFVLYSVDSVLKLQSTFYWLFFITSSLTYSIYTSFFLY